MRIGIILVFNNNEKEITTSRFPNLFFEENDIICFVNNASKDGTLEVLKEIKDQVENISILDIKKNKGNNAAIKAGVRYLKSKESLNCILYFCLENLNDYKKLEEQLLFLIREKGEFANNLSKKNSRKILNNVFAMDTFLEKKVS